MTKFSSSVNYKLIVGQVNCDFVCYCEVRQKRLNSILPSSSKGGFINNSVLCEKDAILASHYQTSKVDKFTNFVEHDNLRFFELFCQNQR